MKRYIVATLAAASSIVHADAAPATLVCSLSGGTFTSMEIDGTVNSKPNSSGTDLTFAAIDLEQHTAQIIGNAGAGPVYVYASETGMNVLEITPSGNMNLLTVMLDDKGGKHPAAYSRHVFTPLIGGMVSQMFGTCLEKN